MNAPLLALAARNVLRNRRRSMLTAGAVLVGVMAAVTLRGVANGYLRGMREMMVRSNVGVVQVHARGFAGADKPPVELDLPATPEFLAKMAAVPGVDAVAPRLVFEGMLNNGTASTMVQVTAVSPAAEFRVTPERFSGGRASSPLVEGDAGKALLGSTLADALGAKDGASLTLLTSTRAGASNALDLTMKGRFTTPNPLETKRTLTLTLDHAQELTGLPDRANEIAIGVREIDDADDVKARLQAALGGDYEVVTWRERLPIFGEVFELIGSIFAIVYVVLFVLVLSGILNTMLMSVYERVREIGTMMAVGTRRRRVLQMFLVESALLGGGGGLAGATVGLVLVTVMNVRGIDFTPPGGTATIHFRPFIAPGYVALSLGIAVVGAVLAALLPALRASRLSPVEALRSV